jgi:carboxylesterase
MRVQSGGEPFLFKGGRVGCLLVHGFPGAPQEMRWLGEYLQQQGYSVLGIRLFGHATDPSELLRVQARDWLSGIEDGYNYLQGICSQIFIIGFSLGGVLSAIFTQKRQLSGLVLMAVPYKLPSLAHYLRPTLPVLKYVWRYRRPKEPSDWFDKEAERINLHYPVQPVHAIGQIHDLMQALPEALKAICIPTLVIEAQEDRSAAAHHGTYVFESVSSDDKAHIKIKGSGHSLARDSQRELVFRHINDFVQRVSKAS